MNLQRQFSLKYVFFLILLITTFGIIVIKFKSAFFPGGLGIEPSQSVTTSIEKNEQGKIIKTVTTTQVNNGKTFWDWFDLLGAPLTLTALGWWYQEMQKKREEKEQKYAEDRIKEEASQTYIDRLSVLLVNKKLLAITKKVNLKEFEESNVTTEKEELLNSGIDIIRGRTLSILREFKNDAERKTSVIRFLAEANIINKLKISLKGAELSGVIFGTEIKDEFVNVDWEECTIDLNNTNFSNSNLYNTEFFHINLSKSNFNYSNLEYSKIKFSNLNDASFFKANLNSSYLIRISLRKAQLGSANFKNASLISVNIANGYLNSTNFTGADLYNVTFENAFGVKTRYVQNLSRCKVL